MHQKQLLAAELRPDPLEELTALPTPQPPTAGFRRKVGY